MLDKSLILQARKANLENYLLSKGKILKKEGRQSRVQGHSGLVVMNNKWYSHSMQKGGNTLDYLINVEGKAFKDAIAILCKYTSYCNTDFSIDKPVISPNLNIPARNSNDKRVMAYLIRTRGINKNIIMVLLKQGRIYEAAGTHNCVFTGIDENMNIKYVMQRSSSSQNSIKFEAKGSDKRYSFCIVGNSEKLYVFESVIDLLSYITLFPCEMKLKPNLLPLGGVSDIALSAFLERINGITEVILCLDNDNVGINAGIEIIQKYSSPKLKLYTHTPQQKDWNQELLSKFKL